MVETIKAERSKIDRKNLDKLRELYPNKFVSPEEAFQHIYQGNRIFIGSACGRPQYLVRSLEEYVEENERRFQPKGLQIWTFGIRPNKQDKYNDLLQHNLFFIGTGTRDAVQRGLAKYTPVFLSEVPELFRQKLVPVDVAIIQTSYPDEFNCLSLGISVDIVRSALENASLVIAQLNKNMPRVHGETFIDAGTVDYLIPFDEPLLENKGSVPDYIAQRIGKYVARIIQDGDTIQVGYGSIPDAIIANLHSKKNLGVHTELISDGIVKLMKMGVVNNAKKDINRGKTVASFCMGAKETYDYLHDNSAIEFLPIDYTNNPLNIARIKNMTAINSALEVDLTGQANAESLDGSFFSGVGGHADFMRGSLMAPGGKTILAMQSTAKGGEVSRIVPFLKEGASVSLTRGDIHYLVTEYGIAYLFGKNIRERAMSLISVAHPKFRPWLIEEAKKLSLIYKDQAFTPGKKGEYPEDLETHRTTNTGLRIFLRPVKITDEPLIKEFFYSLSGTSVQKRFFSMRKDLPHERLQELFLRVNYAEEMVILAFLDQKKEYLVGIGQYALTSNKATAEVAIVVRDKYQNIGIGTEILSYLAVLANKSGLIGFTGESLPENRAILHLFEKIGFEVQKKREAGVYVFNVYFRRY